MDFKNNKKIKSLRQTSQLLLVIPEQNIKVYRDRIVLKYDSQKLQSLKNLETNPTLSQILPSQTKQFYFSQNDIIFKIKQKQKKIILLKIHKAQPLIQLFIEDNSKRNILYQILRKKFCQIGFQNQYNILQEIGKGAMAKVYLVQRKSDNKKFAAKIVSLTTDSEKSYDTFINETKILRILANPHIVSLEGVYVTSKKQLVSILEYLNGGTLYEQLKNNQLKNIKQKFKAIKDITLGLQHLRQKRIVHRDLKLENILVRKINDRKQYVITDFGLSNWIGQQNILYQKCGTPGYIAPEILHEKKGICLLNHSTDVFSLGVLYYFIFMRQSLFKYDGCKQKLLMRNRKADYNLLEAMHQLSRQQFKLLQATLQIDPNQRPTTKQILDKLIPKLQNSLFKKQNPKQNINISASIKKINFNQHTNRSVQIKQERHPSIKKSQLKVNLKSNSLSRKSQRQKDAQNIDKTKKPQSKTIFGEFIQKVSSSFRMSKEKNYSKEKKQNFKIKNKQTQRKQMKSFNLQ